MPGESAPTEWTSTVAQFIAGSPTAGWPEETLELGRRHILDTLAAIVVCRDLETAKVARDFALGLTGGASEGATILGTRLRASLPDAVFASAMTGHGAEINDFCPSAFVQPGPPVVSTALASRNESSGRAPRSCAPSSPATSSRAASRRPRA